MITYEQYSANKHKAQMRADGYVEFAAVEIRHRFKNCNCGGDNLACRVVTRREWRKSTPEGGQQKK